MLDAVHERTPGGSEPISERGKQVRCSKERGSLRCGLLVFKVYYTALVYVNTLLTSAFKIIHMHHMAPCMDLKQNSYTVTQHSHVSRHT